jgi:hypothetical protein
MDVNEMEVASEAPKADYLSVCLSLDHLVRDAAESGKTVLKVIYSTETALASTLAQIAYFKQNDLLQAPGVVSSLAKIEEKAGVVVYVVDGNLTNVIVDAEVYVDALDDPNRGNGSLMGLHASLIDLATNMVRAANSAGKDPHILVFEPN